MEPDSDSASVISFSLTSAAPARWASSSAKCARRRLSKAVRAWLKRVGTREIGCSDAEIAALVDAGVTLAPSP